jgi:DNA polymerase
MRRVSAKGYDIVASVHDEIVCEVPESVTVDEICAIMAEPPEWASDLHLRAAGFETPFYKKD